MHSMVFSLSQPNCGLAIAKCTYVMGKCAVLPNWHKDYSWWQRCGWITSAMWNVWSLDWLKWARKWMLWLRDVRRDNDTCNKCRAMVMERGGKPSGNCFRRLTQVSLHFYGHFRNDNWFFLGNYIIFNGE